MFWNGQFKSSINVDTLVSTLTLRGRHYRSRLVTLRSEKEGYFSEKPKQDQRGSNLGHMHDWRGSQALYQSATSPSLCFKEIIATPPYNGGRVGPDYWRHRDLLSTSQAVFPIDRASTRVPRVCKHVIINQHRPDTGPASTTLAKCRDGVVFTAHFTV